MLPHKPGRYPANQRSAGAQARNMTRILERHAFRTVLGARAARLLRASSLYKASAVSEADSFAEVIGLATGIGSDPDLVERASPSTAKQYRLDIWVLLPAGDSLKIGDCASIRGKRLIAIEARGDLNTPRLGGSARDAQFKLGGKAVGFAFEQRHQLAATGLWFTV